MEGLSLRLRELRKHLGLTQEAVAAKLGVSCQAVSKWETGAASPDLGLIVPLARLLEVSTDALLGNDRRDHWEARWQAALPQGPKATLAVAEAALAELPRDQTFRYRRACDEFLIGKDDPDGAGRGMLERSAAHFRELTDIHPELSSSAGGMLVDVLAALGRL